MYYTIVYISCDSGGAFGQRGYVLIGPPSYTEGRLYRKQLSCDCVNVRKVMFIIQNTPGRCLFKLTT